MNVFELVEKYGCQLCFFDDDEIKKDGFFIPECRIVGVRKNLPEHIQKSVILHELGHHDHAPYVYSINPVKCENQADRHMIKRLLIDYIEEHGTEFFNWLNFAQLYNLNSVTQETIIKQEFKKLI